MQKPTNLIIDTLTVVSLRIPWMHQACGPVLVEVWGSEAPEAFVIVDLEAPDQALEIVGLL